MSSSSRLLNLRREHLDDRHEDRVAGWPAGVPSASCRRSGSCNHDLDIAIGPRVGGGRDPQRHEERARDHRAARPAVLVVRIRRRPS